MPRALKCNPSGVEEGSRGQQGGRGAREVHAHACGGFIHSWNQIGRAAVAVTASLLHCAQRRPVGGPVYVIEPRAGARRRCFGVGKRAGRIRGDFWTESSTFLGWLADD